MRKLLVMLLATLVACSGTEPPSESSAESAPTLRDLYACNFVAGKGMSDLDDARDFLVEQIAQIGSTDLDNMVSFLWTPYKARTEYDFLWFNQYESIAAFGRAETALAERAAAVNAKFGAVVACDSSLSTREQIYDGGGGDFVTGNQALLETYACTLNPGKNMADVAAAVDHWHGVISGINGFENYDAYMATPYIATTPVDLFYLGVHNNVSDFAAHTTAYLDSPGAAEADRRLAEVHDCESSLWWGRIMIGQDG